MLPAVIGEQWMGTGLAATLVWAVLATGAAAQAPATSPGEAPAPAPAAFPGEAPATSAAAAPGAARAPLPVREAREHDCASLFEEDDSAELDADEECFRDPQTRWRWTLGFTVGPTVEDAWDDSLAARGYGPSDVAFGGETSLLRRFGRYFSLGARTGVRDLRWVHHERPAASIFGWDLLIVADLRVPIGQREIVALGIDAGGGLGLAFSSLNEGRSTDVGWRVVAEALISFALVGPASFAVRLGYDHFPVTIGDSLDAHLGGFRATLALEIVE
ncbi:MAG: hypothetical protein CMN30_08885 [Sandaracinus sp.]|nr:hypothetical protein [Sandaracinus sp.]|tara:strand:+ start:1807 stop:2628 length:822 start_codon:yes stop_codon:yes gene_type:complete